MLFEFCPRCGKAMHTRSARPHCPECGFVQYLNPTVGVAVILLEQNRLLLVRRLGSHQGQWCIPCGHLEWDEDVREGARREMWEETGLDVEIGPVFEALSNFHDPLHHTVGVWFWGRRVSGQPTAGSDASEVCFFSLDALPKNMAFPTDRIICQKLNHWVRNGKQQPLRCQNPVLS